MTDFVNGLQKLEEGRLDMGDALLFELMVKTGLRYYEVATLQPGDIDLMLHRLLVKRALMRVAPAKARKPNEVRKVDLSAGLLKRMATFLTLPEAEAAAQAAPAGGGPGHVKTGSISRALQ